MLLLVAIPITLSGTAYALFTQQLSIDPSTAKPSYSYSQNLLMTYTKTVTVVNSTRWQYTVLITVNNIGSLDVNSWHISLTIPSNANSFSCTGATCANATGAVTVDNSATNGTIVAGGSVSFTMKFRLTTDVYTLDNVNVSGTYAPVYQSISGLTETWTRGSRSKAGGVFYWPFTFTVHNNSGSALTGWRILIPWDTAVNKLKNAPTTISYYEAPTQLTLIANSSIAKGATFKFTISLGSTSSAWVLSGDTIEGAY